MDQNPAAFAYLGREPWCPHPHRWHYYWCMTSGDGISSAEVVARWDALFPLVRDEWTRIRVEDWTRRFAVAKAEYDLLRSHGLWKEPSADFFGVTGISRKEHQHSNMLRWLLDPREMHGLGTSFVRRMLNLCEVGERKSVSVGSVQREVTAWTKSGKRTPADIVVQGEDLVLVIENKVDNEPDRDQCERLRECFGEEATTTLFMFLSPDKESPLDDFTSVHYRDVREALEDALAGTSDVSATDRVLAENYVLTLRREFG